MNRIAVLAGIVLLSGSIAQSLPAQGLKNDRSDDKKAEAKETAGVAWTQDYEDGLKEAEKSKKLIFIEVTATW